MPLRQTGDPVLDGEANLDPGTDLAHGTAAPLALTRGGKVQVEDSADRTTALLEQILAEQQETNVLLRAAFGLS